ncbi:hypothetical protein ACIRF8_01950 [Streptomyces sp. NPDC102406]|uniref:hypothetical protein n=1 Tax=Streptomyces sp. NPDC102406 TaxID=3366171 RepID=UPI00382030D5
MNNVDNANKADKAVEEQPDRLDWFRQQPQRPAVPHLDADPVRTVWQLPRFRIGSRRFTGRIDHALVCVTRKGGYETFLPPDRPPSVRRFVALYEVDTEHHAFPLSVPLPSRLDSFEFEATADISWRVTDPERFVRSQERDVPGLITRELLPVLRRASRDHAIEASAEAEHCVQEAVAAASWIGVPQGLRIACSLRLRRDAAERFHQSRLRNARHEMEAATPEHRASRLREEQEAERIAARITFYEETLARGGTAALALHLATHPEETKHVLQHLSAGQDRLLDTQVHLINEALQTKRLEHHELEIPRRLVAERMEAILRAPGPAEEGLPVPVETRGNDRPEADA